MRTLATKQPSHQDSAHQKPVMATPVPVARSLSTVSPASAMLQRKPGCACGGGCPRCQEQGLLQTKLKISEPGDEYEQEADLIADRVMRMPEPSVQRQMESEEDEEEGMVQRQAISGSITPLVQRQVSPDIEEEEEEVIQTKTIDDRADPSASTPASSGVPAIVHKVLNSPGQPLDLETCTFMESRFGHDFSQVRVHSDMAAEQSAQDINAHAYTVGQDIVFGASRLMPGTQEGRRLLAHELTHVVQQSGSDSARVDQSGDKSGLSPISHELTHVVQRNRHTVASAPVVQRKPKPGDRKATKPANKAPKISKGPASSTPGLKNSLDAKAKDIIAKAKDSNTTPKLEDRAVEAVTNIITTYYSSLKQVNVDSVIFNEEKAGNGLHTFEKFAPDSRKHEDSTGIIYVGKIFLEGMTEKAFARRVLQVGHELEHITQYRSGLFAGKKQADEREFRLSSHPGVKCSLGYILPQDAHYGLSSQLSSGFRKCHSFYML